MVLRRLGDNHVSEYAREKRTSVAAEILALRKGLRECVEVIGVGWRECMSWVGGSSVSHMLR